MTALQYLLWAAAVLALLIAASWFPVRAVIAVFRPLAGFLTPPEIPVVAVEADTGPMGVLRGAAASARSTATPMTSTATTTRRAPCAAARSGLSVMTRSSAPMPGAMASTTLIRHVREPVSRNIR